MAIHRTYAIPAASIAISTITSAIFSSYCSHLVKDSIIHPLPQQVMSIALVCLLIFRINHSKSYLLKLHKYSERISLQLEEVALSLSGAPEAEMLLLQFHACCIESDTFSEEREDLHVKKDTFPNRIRIICLLRKFTCDSAVALRISQLLSEAQNEAYQHGRQLVQSISFWTDFLLLVHTCTFPIVSSICIEQIGFSVDENIEQLSSAMAISKCHENFKKRLQAIFLFNKLGDARFATNSFLSAIAGCEIVDDCTHLSHVLSSENQDKIPVVRDSSSHNSAGLHSIMEQCIESNHAVESTASRMPEQETRTPPMSEQRVSAFSQAENLAHANDGTQLTQECPPCPCAPPNGYVDSRSSGEIWIQGVARVQNQGIPEVDSCTGKSRDINQSSEDFQESLCQVKASLKPVTCYSNRNNIQTAVKANNVANLFFPSPLKRSSSLDVDGGGITTKPASPQSLSSSLHNRLPSVSPSSGEQTVLSLSPSSPAIQNNPPVVPPAQLKASQEHQQDSPSLVSESEHRGLSTDPVLERQRAYALYKAGHAKSGMPVQARQALTPLQNRNSV